MAKFQVGDIVRLRSGGPDMTVDGLREAGTGGKQSTRVECVWFSGKKNERATFDAQSIEPVPPAGAA